MNNLHGLNMDKIADFLLIINGSVFSLFCIYCICHV